MYGLIYLPCIYNNFFSFWYVNKMFCSRCCPTTVFVKMMMTETKLCRTIQFLINGHWSVSRVTLYRNKLLKKLATNRREADVSQVPWKSPCPSPPSQYYKDAATSSTFIRMVQISPPPTLPSSLLISFLLLTLRQTSDLTHTLCKVRVSAMTLLDYIMLIAACTII